MRSRTNRAVLAATISLAAALLAAPAAFGSTVTVNENTVRVLESGNERNDIAVSYDAGADLYTVIDRVATLTPSGACAGVDANTATCPGAGITRIRVDVADRDDSITLDDATIPASITELLDGGPGNDLINGANGPGSLQGGSGNDQISGRGTLSGESGNDTVTGSPLADTVRGGTGRDFVDGGDGADDLAGGGGADTLLYPTGRASPVFVTVGSQNHNDGGAEDQTGSGRDTVHGDIEVLVGTVANDVLIGDSSGESMFGGPGADLLIGNRGNDSLFGMDGDDLISGGEGRDTERGALGDDRLQGGPDGDRLAGGPGNDFMKGKRGSDVMKGKKGIDRIRAKDGLRDVKISCGPGPNRLEKATRDRRLDPRARSC
jgi:Ca2+-binding RTX toxin-like protein